MQSSTFRRLHVVAFLCCLVFAAGSRAVAAPDVPQQRPPAAQHAAASTGPVEFSAADELTRLQEQTVLLKAELRKLDAQAQVAERTAALSRLSGAADAAHLGRSGDGGLRVTAVEGIGRSFSATLVTADGQQFEVAAGDTLPNGLRIVSVGANEVLGRWENGRSIRLMPTVARGGAVFNSSAQAAAGSGAGVPGLPSGYPASSKE
ncbi:type IV pilus biogenesis protein PilP [Paraburkholderia rhizosphaerae]|uniref:Type IV pilus biogenesis protein PilP n=1 Tax=Paraburkholderia rhizosphaerae TaxID=480658 RepID=A0A4R8LLZ5_9BURK|nr:type IV pilus biogenesis protein PilP [Paraburkholderia rhizosphaerae]TDY45186.1 type IV pilus biogenesis protein PilP [Paraburkholderia rhizosphaerae]